MNGSGRRPPSLFYVLWYGAGLALCLAFMLSACILGKVFPALVDALCVGWFHTQLARELRL